MLEPVHHVNDALNNSLKEGHEVQATRTVWNVFL